MTFAPADAFRGSLIVAMRDLRVNARGLKVWIISGLTLLAILGAAFGISGLSSQAPSVAAENVLWTSPYWPANNSTAGIVVWVSDYLGVPHSGETVLLGNPLPANGTPTAFTERSRALTNATGWAVFANLGPGNWPVRIVADAIPITRAEQLPAQRPTLNLTYSLNRFDLLGDGAARDVSLHAMHTDGSPASGAVVAVNGTIQGTLDANGFFYDRLDDGVWLVSLTDGSQTLAFTVTVQRSPLSILPYLQGPDALLLFLGVALMGIFAPIIAIAMSYDAIAKERMQGSLELLLARPASRTGIAIGKFLGSFLSVALPMLGVLLGAVVGVAAASGKWPDGTFVVAFVFGTMGLIAAYVLIMQIFSTVAKGAGTAILSAIVVWLVFNIVWSLAFLAIEAALGIRGGTPEAFRLATLVDLFNPTNVYTLTVTTFAPASVIGLFGTTGGGSLPDWTGPVAMGVWILALLILAVLVFRKRIV